MSNKPCHFYVAFNPLFNGDSLYKTQAHEFYYSLKEKVLKDHKSHMYWGKLKVSEYSELLNQSHFQQVITTNNGMGAETHLYISDYQHLWVAKVSEVLPTITDFENTLDFYKDKNVEIWFKITDFDLVSQETNHTTQLLTQLFVENEFYKYKIKEITPFSSGLRFPMIVQDKNDERHFRDFDQSISHRLKLANSMIDAPGESIKVKHIVQSFVIPEENFKKLPALVRGQLVTAEILLVESTVGGKKDRKKLEQSILTYLRCLEVLLNDTFISHLKKEQGHRIFVTQSRPQRFLRSAMEKDKAEIMMLKDSKENFGLGQIKMLLDAPTFFPHTTLDWTFRNKKKFWEYCRLDLRHILKNESLAELRNSLAEGKNVTANDRELLFVRNVLLGVGNRGVFNDIIKNFYADEDSSENVA